MIKIVGRRIRRIHPNSIGAQRLMRIAATADELMGCWGASQHVCGVVKIASCASQFQQAVRDKTPDTLPNEMPIDAAETPSKTAHGRARARMPNHIWPRGATDSTYGQCQCVCQQWAPQAPRAPHRTRSLLTLSISCSNQTLAAK